MKNHYQTLSLSPSASLEQIKTAYANAIFKAQGQPNFASRFAELQQAYEILSNPSTRKKFDDELLSFYTGQFVNHSTTTKKPAPPYSVKRYYSILRDFGIILLIVIGVLYLVMHMQTCNEHKPQPVVTEIPNQNPSDLSFPSSIGSPKKSEPVTSQPVPIESPFKGKHLSNGSSPFDECFGSGDYSGNASLLVKNGSSSEAIVCLYDVNSGITIRNEYVRTNSSYTLSNIPQGSYKIRVLYGNDWNPNATSPCGSTGFFDSDVDFSEKDNSVFFSDNETGTTHATYTLYSIIGGNSTSSKIDKSKFFRK